MSTGWPARPRFVALAIAATACLAALLVAGPATAGRPAPAGHYFGFPGDGVSGGEGYVYLTGELRVARSGRSVAPATLKFYCRRGRAEVPVRLFGPSGRRSAVSIGRDGRFEAEGRRGVARYRLRGRFVTRDVARIVYVERLPARRRGCRSIISFYRNGVPPFSGCRSQRAFTHLWADSGRVFAQYTLNPRSREYFIHAYACLFASSSERFDLGQNYDDERVDTFRLVGPFVAFFRGGCAACTFDQRSIEVLDLRDGSLASQPSVPFWSRLYDLALKANGSLAWTLDRLALAPDGNPVGYPIDPPMVAAREVWALDSQGQRLLDSDLNLALDSLELKESTAYWLNGTSARSATLE